jgi:hypothetical protein
MFDYNKDGSVTLADLTAFLKAKTFGLANWMLVGLTVGAYYFFFSVSGKRQRRRMFR